AFRGHADLLAGNVRERAERRIGHHHDVPAGWPRRSDANDLFLDAFLHCERHARRKEIDDVGRPGRECLLRRGPAAISGDLGRHAIFLVIAKLLGRVDRCERTIIGDREPDLDGCLGVHARYTRQQSAGCCEMRGEPADPSVLHLVLPLLYLCFLGPTRRNSIKQRVVIPPRRGLAARLYPKRSNLSRRRVIGVKPVALARAPCCQSCVTEGATSSLLANAGLNTCFLFSCGFLHDHRGSILADVLVAGKGGPAPSSISVRTHLLSDRRNVWQMAFWQKSLDGRRNIPGLRISLSFSRSADLISRG